jgi:diguanylate cyclase (GGDEF)-like protein
VFLGLALMTAPTLTLTHSGLGSSELVALAATAACSAFVLTRFTNAVREQERAQTQLAYQARHDPLTGLANRTSLDDRLRQLLGVADRPVSVLYLDLDGFKDVNDRYGHEAGDRVLTTVAARLSGLVRAGDMVARLGGDEFVVVCPDLDAARVTEVAAQILHEVARPVPFGDVELTVGVSVGAAVRGDAVQTPSELLRAADAGMYDAKRQGRGRWVLVGGPEPVTADAVR